MSNRRFDITCPSCGASAKVVGRTICADGAVKRRCECAAHHRFWMGGTPHKLASYDGPILSAWRPYPFTDTAALARAAL